ncbi:MAG: molybdopterin-dependent oxidoreductase [Lachnospiraceae bacterium]|nr:molybdopterin-dependent oxidoreductase [Lachnospiraceae bacterium]
MNQLSYELLNETYLKEQFGCSKDGIITVPTASHNNCGSRCVIKIRIQNGKILDLSTDTCHDTQDYPQIRSCVKGHSYLDTFLSKDRILYPMKRIGKRGEGKFQRISWREAVTFIAQEMTRIKKTYGPEARYCNYATGYEMCAASPSVMIRRLLALDGGYLGYYNNYSCSPSSLAANMMYGTNFTGNSRNDYVNSKLILLWGFNPAETYCGGNTMYSLLQAKRAGAKIIVIDPRFSDTAASLADVWIAPKPTTDEALSDAMAYTIYTKQLHKQNFLDTFCLGFDQTTMPKDIPPGESYLDYLMGKKDGIPKTPIWASKITGVDAEIIESLAIEYASAEPAAILEGYGPGRHAFGEQFSRGLITLACMTGNVGISGGSAAGLGMVPNGANFLTEAPGLISNPYPGKIPCFCWTDVIQNAKAFTPELGLQGIQKLDNNIKMIFNLAGNCLINQHSDCNHTAALLADTDQVECIVCSDIFLTPSAKYADILLPGTTMLETENITASPARFDDFFKINPVIKPIGESRFDYDWICDVAEELGLLKPFSEQKSLNDWLTECVENLQKKLPDFPDMNTFTSKGVYKRNSTKKYIAFETQIQNPSHVPFPTPSGKIEIFVRSLYEQYNPNLNPLPGYMPAWEGPFDPLIEKYPLQCIGFHIKSRTHSVHDNNKKLNSLIPHELWMHPQDAKSRSINSHDLVHVYNDRGKICIPVKITERILPGTVAIPQGAWFSPDETGIDQRGCINTLTSLKSTPIAKANAQHTNLVEVEKASDPIAKKEASHQEEAPVYQKQTMKNCSGCLACMAACPHGRMKVIEEHTKDIHKPVRYHPISCGQCETPACVSSCPLRLL